jgi:hypothetical protein
MTGAQALNLIMARLGNRTGTTLRANILLEMQLAQDNFTEKLKFMPWFLREDYTNAGFVTVDGVETVAVPASHLRIDDEWGALFYQDTTITSTDQWMPIRKDAYLAFKDKEFEAVDGKPQYFDILGTLIYLRPYPDAAYPLRILHYKKDTALTDDSNTNLWLTYAQNWLIGEAGFVAASLHVKDDAAAQYFLALAQQARDGLLVETEARKHSGQSYSMGEL